MAFPKNFCRCALKQKLGVEWVRHVFVMFGLNHVFVVAFEILEEVLTVKSPLTTITCHAYFSVMDEMSFWMGHLMCRSCFSSKLVIIQSCLHLKTRIGIKQVCVNYSSCRPWLVWYGLCVRCTMHH